MAVCFAPPRGRGFGPGGAGLGPWWSVADSFGAVLLLWFLNVKCSYTLVYVVLSGMVTQITTAHSASCFVLICNLE